MCFGIEYVIHQFLVKRIFSKRTYNIRAEMLLINQIVFISCPEFRIYLCLSIGIPIILIIIGKNTLSRRCKYLVFILHIAFQSSQFLRTTFYTRHIYGFLNIFIDSIFVKIIFCFIQRYKYICHTGNIRNFSDVHITLPPSVSVLIPGIY